MLAANFEGSDMLLCLALLVCPISNARCNPLSTSSSFTSFYSALSNPAAPAATASAASGTHHFF